MKTEDQALYHAVENNTLLKDVLFYVLHLLQLQNMHEYMVPAQDSDIVDVPAIWNREQWYRIRVFSTY